MEEETEEEELKEVMQRLIHALKAKGWTGKEITDLFVEILETDNQEENEEIEMMSDKEMARLIEYLRSLKWTEKQINDLLLYLAKDE
jgi:hypothetical protein